MCVPVKRHGRIKHVLGKTKVVHPVVNTACGRKKDTVAPEAARCG